MNTILKRALDQCSGSDMSTTYLILGPYIDESFLKFIDFVRTYSKAKNMKSVFDYKVHSD